MTYTYINEDQIDIELKCTICEDPFQSPVNCTSCGNTYCQSCIKKWMEQQLSCPSCRKVGIHFSPVISRVVLNQLSRLLVQCSLCQETNIQRSNFNDHISGSCPNQIVNCPDNCGWKGQRRNLQPHVVLCQQNRYFGIRKTQWWKTIFFLILSILLYFVVGNKAIRK